MGGAFRFFVLFGTISSYLQTHRAYATSIISLGTDCDCRSKQKGT